MLSFLSSVTNKRSCEAMLNLGNGWKIFRSNKWFYLYKFDVLICYTNNNRLTTTMETLIHGSTFITVEQFDESIIYMIHCSNVAYDVGMTVIGSSHKYHRCPGFVHRYHTSYITDWKVPWRNFLFIHNGIANSN